MEELFSRMRKIVSYISNGNAKDFARKTGIPYGTLQGYFRKRTPQAEHLARMVSNANINANWILTGKGSKLISEKQNTDGYDDSSSLNVDTEILKAIITWLEERLKKEKKKLTPEKKAAFIALAYQFFTMPNEKETHEIDNDTICQLFTLVA